MTIADKNKDIIFNIASTGGKIAVTIGGEIRDCAQISCSNCIAGADNALCRPTICNYLNQKISEFKLDELVEVSDNGIDWRLRHFAGMSDNKEYPYNIYDAGYTNKDSKPTIFYRYCRKYGTLGDLV